MTPDKLMLLGGLAFIALGAINVADMVTLGNRLVRLTTTAFLFAVGVLFLL